jgi:ribosomal protein S18 acetylase RimI-like enzyme
MKNGEIAGLVTFRITGHECEIVTLNSTIENRGLGSALVRKVLEDAKAGQVHRVWLITTNDNLKAAMFYQKRGFRWAAFHRNAIVRSRELKPQIPEWGIGNIPILHELEFEYILKRP